MISLSEFIQEQLENCIGGKQMLNEATVNEANYKMRSTDYKLVDLGLPSGTLWMDRNIGAKEITDSGLYFAWGETKGYKASEIGKTRKFIWDDYKYINDAYDKLTKYCNDSDYGDEWYTDNLVTLQTSDDAVYAATNGECCMPTKEQLKELINNTTYDWAVEDSVSGGRFYSKTNDNSIFIPAAGYCCNGSAGSANKFGLLWSSSLYEDNPCDAYYLSFSSMIKLCKGSERYYGLPVRGVKSK